MRQRVEIGFAKIVLTSDPNAEEFYLGQGAARIGQKASSIRDGRMLPILECQPEHSLA